MTDPCCFSRGFRRPSALFPPLRSRPRKARQSSARPCQPRASSFPSGDKARLAKPLSSQVTWATRPYVSGYIILANRAREDQRGPLAKSAISAEGAPPARLRERQNRSRGGMHRQLAVFNPSRTFPRHGWKPSADIEVQGEVHAASPPFHRTHGASRRRKNFMLPLAGAVICCIPGGTESWKSSQGPWTVGAASKR